ncbi:hypothetical protein NUSPORA_02519 [Nucleospora cyclopteri]
MSHLEIYLFIEFILFNILSNSQIIDLYIIFLRSLSFWNSKIISKIFQKNLNIIISSFSCKPVKVVGFFNGFIIIFTLLQILEILDFNECTL